MKLIIQIPAYNEIETLAETVADLPREIDGIDEIEYLVIDDGSQDGTGKLARDLGVHHIVTHITNRGLARSFQDGLDAALAAGADIIVNTDADNQYAGKDIEKLVRPILNGDADIVIGDRGVGDHSDFSSTKQYLQRIGSFVVSRFAHSRIPDAVSGFRAISREAAQRIHIVSKFSYTTEMLIQAGRNRLAVVSVPIATNTVERPSRLFSSIPAFIARSGSTILRAYAMYYPLKVFLIVGAIPAFIGAAAFFRFLVFYITGDGAGHIQSLIAGGTLLMLGTVVMVMGMLADLIGRNRQLTEAVLERVKRLEFELQSRDAAPREVVRPQVDLEAADD